MLSGATGSGGTGRDPPVVVVVVVVVDPGSLVATLAGVPPMYIETGQVRQVWPLFQMPGRDFRVVWEDVSLEQGPESRSRKYEAPPVPRIASQ
jgi:hypothetical protein